jgi:hypothetical protein
MFGGRLGFMFGSMLTCALVVAMATRGTARADSAAPAAAPAEQAANGTAAPDADADATDDSADTDADDAAENAAIDQAEPVSPEVQKEFDHEFQDVPHEVGAGGDETISIERLRALIRAARAKVLPRLEAKIEAKSQQRMATISHCIQWISLAGLLLLAMPLVLRKRHPGQGAQLFKYSLVAALAFIVTVNLFGLIAIGFRGAQAGLAKQTNPQLKLAEGFFTSIDEKADELAPLGSQLFAPTLYQLQSTGEQPTALLLENGKKLFNGARVFIAIGKFVKSLDFVFAVLPMVLLVLTLALFVRSIWPTLYEIIRLPTTALSGTTNARTVVRNAIGRIGGELLVALCTVGVLFALTIISSEILGYVVKPAVYLTIEFFGTAIYYMQLVPDASGGLVFDSLCGIILFLAFNLVVIIIAVSVYLGKAQRLFQLRFHDHQPLRDHLDFWKWGTVSVIGAQLVPLVYMFFASWAIDKLESHWINGVTDPSQMPWGRVMLAGPLLLLIGFGLALWGGRALRGLSYMLAYKLPKPGATPRSGDQLAPR